MFSVLKGRNRRAQGNALGGMIAADNHRPEGPGQDRGRRSIPDIALVIVDPIPLEEGPVFLLKRSDLVMLFLMIDVLPHLRHA
jgi:hypothetical protein